MRKYISLVMVVLVLGLMSTWTQAADKYVTVPTVLNHVAGSTLNITFPANSDSTGSQHTYPIFIGNINDADAYVDVITNAAADFNVIFHYSNDLTNWKSITATGLDACSNTQKLDTLGTGDQAYFHTFNWLIVESDGQAAANSTDILYMNIQCSADAKVPGPSGQALRHTTYNSGGASTNP